ncbi:ABC transporter ATP-binding protein [Aliarcobacter skirrowii]|uniref:energy-coupling factor ABC transporter ATP-binding protein n=1 Tax=Aliarcobacter skirrowii TaxID=28200 RepID=UPI0032081CBC
MSCSINLKDISYKKDEKILFENVSFDLGHKEKVAIIGKNGVGKSTLLKIIAGLKNQNSGTIDIFHNRINKKEDYEKYRDEIAYLPQDIDNFFLSITVIEDVMFSLLALGVKKAEAYKKSLDILKNLDILHLENRVIYDLSGGEKKLVALAAILIKEPKILLLDEPTNNLDDDGEKKLIDILKSIEKSMIIVSHQKTFIDSLVTKIYILEEKTLKVY